MKIENLSAYELIEKRHSEDIKSESYLLRHKKSGAKLCVLENDDENKVFYIAFRTPPKDSTGVAHILEHSVLCGSASFPLKDPFVELVKSSLNTFLNAMTYPDKTVYPVASCNAQDFKNLMHVYMDAVLHPNIYKEEKIFRQEGWHYETDDKDELVINGVVYNEMKGAFSSPDDVLARETFSSLYPDSTYGVESGGDPAFIPELSYEAFLDFHRTYYHPANSYIYLYGDADMEERLAWLDKEYLSAYDKIEVDSFPGSQKAFDAPKRVRKEYPISEGESEEKQTYLSYNATIGDVLDPKLYIAFQMIDYALAGADGTPLRKALLSEGIGTEISSMYENGIYQPYFSIVAKNADESQLDKFVELVEAEFARAAAGGIDENALMASVNNMEFHFREADTGRYPKGLLYGLKALDSWLYDDLKPLIHIESLAIYDELRSLIGTDYYSGLVKKYLCDNPHKSILVLAPKKGLGAQRDKALADELAEYKKSLSPEEFEAIKKAAAELKAYQDEEDGEEVKACLPSLSRSDLRKEVLPLINKEGELAGAKALMHEIETNGIIYLSLLFDLSGLPMRLYPYAGLLSLVLCSMDTEHYDYEQLGYEMDKQCGTLNAASMYAVPGFDTKKFKLYLSMNLSCLDSRLEASLALLSEVMFGTKLSDKARLKEIIAEERSRMAATMTGAAHNVASMRALSYVSDFAKASDMVGGIDFFRFLEDAEQNFDQKADALCEGLLELCAFAFRRDNLLIDVTGTKEEFELLNTSLGGLLAKLSDKKPAFSELKLSVDKKNEGFGYSGQVQYVCRAGSFAEHGLAYKGSLHVLHTILGYEYLWNEVRVKGGAYGCMNRFSLTGEAYFVSYRDPNLKKTVDVFEHAAEFIRNFSADDKRMTRYIIGTLGEMDAPLSPRGKGRRSLQAWLYKDSEADMQKRRDELLSATQEDIRALAEYVEAFMSDEAFCVVGNEDTLKEAEACFTQILPLFSK